MGALPGIAIGHWHDAAGVTGCTVLLPLAGAMRAGVAVGNAPATRETDLLAPTATVQEIHALLLTGGSAFGLEAAGGVMAYLRERDIGFDTRVARVPIVPAAGIFDLDSGSAAAYPTAAAGYAACAASAPDEAREGSVGAGYGACVGRLLGPDCRTKGGLGLAAGTLEGSTRTGSGADGGMGGADGGMGGAGKSTGGAHGGVRVGALAVVNAVGDVIDEEGRVLAGARRAGRFAGSAALLRAGAAVARPLANTTLVAVATDARLDKTALTWLARLGHDGLARAIDPAHTAYDGDTVFALSTGDAQAPGDNSEVPRDALGALAVELVAAAIRRAVRMATGVAGVPAAAEVA